MNRTFANAFALMTVTAAAALASPITFLGTQGNQSYTAVFVNLGGGVLQLTLTNTGTVAPNDESGVLGALFFSLNGDPALTPVSVVLGSGSSIVNGSGNPGPHWEYLGGLSGPGGATDGISAAGYGIFGSGNFCSGTGCGNSLQGIDWGLVDSAYTAGSGNGSISGQVLIQDTAVFLLSGLPDGFDPSTGVTDVGAQYTATVSGSGTVTNFVPGSDPPTPSVPEPSTCVLLGAALVAMGVGRRTGQHRQ